jgi:hypothetical protein
MIKSRRTRWVRNVVRKGMMRNVCTILVGKPEGKRPVERHRHKLRMILTWILGKYGWRVWMFLSTTG